MILLEFVLLSPLAASLFLFSDTLHHPDCTITRERAIYTCCECTAEHRKDGCKLGTEVMEMYNLSNSGRSNNG